MTINWHALRAPDTALPALRGTIHPVLPYADVGRPDLNLYIDADEQIRAWTALRLDLAASGPGLYRFLEYGDGRFTQLPLPDLEVESPLLRAVPGGGWLVAGRYARVDERNAHLFRMDGTLVASFHIDDGLADVQATESHVWVSFSDRAIFGERQTILHRGLAAFGLDGTLLATLAEMSPKRRGFGVMAPYALNASDDDVWLYYYARWQRQDSFFLLKISLDEPVRRWAVPVHGARAFALGDRCVLFAGSYQYRNLLTLFDLSTLRAREVRAEYNESSRTYPITLFDSVVGRGSSLYLRYQHVLYHISLKTLSWDSLFNP